MVEKFKPVDVVTILVLIIAFVLLLTGIDGKVGWTLVAVVCAYYGIDLTPYIKIGRNVRAKKEEK